MKRTHEELSLVIEQAVSEINKGYVPYVRTNYNNELISSICEKYKLNEFKIRRILNMEEC